MLKIIVLMCSVTIADGYCTQQTAVHTFHGAEFMEREKADCGKAARKFAIGISKQIDLHRFSLDYACVPMGENRSS